MDNLPQMHPSHLQERASFEKLEAILPKELFLLRKEDGGDYGVDRILEVVAQGLVTNIRSHIQVKSTGAITKKDQTFSFPVPISTLNYLLNSLNSLFLVYSETDEVFYWEWAGSIAQDFRQSRAKTGKAKNKTYSFRFSKIFGQAEIRRIHERLLNDAALVKSLNLETSPFARVLVTDYLQNASYRDYLKMFVDQKYEKVIALVKDGTESSATLWSLVALCYYNIYNYDEALKFISKAEDMEQNPEFSKIRVAILCEKGIREANRVSLFQAKELFLSIESDSWSWMDSYNYANILSALGELDEAELNYRNALGLEPTEAMIWKNLSDVYRKRADYENELAYLNRALELNPTLIEALICKGILLGQQFSNYEQALNLLEDALEKSRLSFMRNASIFYWIAAFHNELGNYSDSLERINEGLKLNPGDGYLESLRLKTLLLGSNESEHFENEAIRLLEEIKTKFPLDTKVQTELLRLLSRKKKVVELLPLVIEAFSTQAYRIEPEVVSGLEMEEIIFILDNYEALIDFRKVANFTQLLFEHYNLSVVKAQRLETRANFLFSELNAKFNDAAPEALLNILQNYAAEFQKFGETCAEVLISATEADSSSVKAEAITELVTTLPEILLTEFSRQAGWLIQRYGLPVSLMDQVIESTDVIKEWFSASIEPILRGANNVLNWVKEGNQ